MTDRYKSDEEMTAADWAALRRTGERPEREEYRAARCEALEAAGLDAAGYDEPKAIDDMSADDHYQQIRRRP